MPEAQLWEPLVKSIKGAKTPEVVETAPDEEEVEAINVYDLPDNEMSTLMTVKPSNYGFRPGDILWINNEMVLVDWLVGGDVVRVSRAMYGTELGWQAAGSRITRVAKARKENE